MSPKTNLYSMVTKMQGKGVKRNDAFVTSGMTYYVYRYQTKTSFKVHRNKSYFLSFSTDKSNL